MLDDQFGLLALYLFISQKSCLHFNIPMRKGEGLNLQAVKVFH